MSSFYSKVVDTNNHVLYKKQDAQKGKFAFTTDDYDMFEVCFQSEGILHFTSFRAGVIELLLSLLRYNSDFGLLQIFCPGLSDPTIILDFGSNWI